MDKLKKATTIMKEFRDNKTDEKERDLALKRAIFGQSLPDITTWEEYLSDEDNLKQCHEQLDIMEHATEQEIQFLENRPGNSEFTSVFFYHLGLFFLQYSNSTFYFSGKSMLRDTFNAIVEFVATKQLLTAARPGELTKCTFAEVQQATMYRDVLYISVAKHKTGNIKQATIAVEKEDQETFLRYVAILKRFKKSPTLAFPVLSPSKGFVVSTTLIIIIIIIEIIIIIMVSEQSLISNLFLFFCQEHTNIPRRLNNWAHAKGREHFTCTKLRKVVETTADLYGSSQDKELVASGLQHSGKTASKYYRVQTW